MDHGINAETDLPFARALCHPKHRYLGVYMRYRKKFPSFKRQLNLALRHLARQGNLKWVSLLMWAGGDPHLRLPDIGEQPSPRTDTSALEEAVALTLSNWSNQNEERQPQPTENSSQSAHGPRLVFNASAPRKEHEIKQRHPSERISISRKLSLRKMEHASI